MGFVIVGGNECMVCQYEKNCKRHGCKANLRCWKLSDIGGYDPCRTAFMEHPASLNETAGTEAGDLPNILPEEPNVPSEDSGILHDGVYTGGGMGMNAKITVEVTISDGEISTITVLSSREDEPYYSDALAVIDDILSANSVEVDTVSGATYSSGGIIDAVEDALREAAKP